MSAARDVAVRELTSHGVGGIAVIEVEGPGAWDRVRELVPSLPAPSLAPRRVELSRGDDRLDEALALVQSRERIELHVHGSPALVRRLLSELGARAFRAPLSLEQRASQLLERAPCEAAARILLDQSEGALRRELEALLRADESEARARLDVLLERSRRAAFALEPRRVVLAGPVNAGKSTLFNALYGQRRVIVSSHAGTTRDVVGELVAFGVWPVELLDTAGERDASSSVERGGQQLAREARASADLVLWLQPVASASVAPAADSRTRVLLTHADASGDVAANPPRISALARPVEAVEVVHALFRDAFGLSQEAWQPGTALAFDELGRGALASSRQSSDWRAPLRAALSAE